jgi:hypothetical protein
LFFLKKTNTILPILNYFYYSKSLVSNKTTIEGIVKQDKVEMLEVLPSSREKHVVNMKLSELGGSGLKD